MESKVKLAGHPIHPMIIVLPLGLYSISVIFDIIRMITGNEILATVSYWNIAAGIIGGLAAAVSGTVDWLPIPAGTRAKQIGLWHGVGNVVVTGLFTVSWFMRSNEPGYVPSTLAFLLVLTALLLSVVTGWLGGELVDRLGVGVDNGANLNAPSSLSGKPAREGATGGERV